MKIVCTSSPATRAVPVVLSPPSRLVSVDRSAAESVRVETFLCGGYCGVVVYLFFLLFLPFIYLIPRFPYKEYSFPYLSCFIVFMSMIMIIWG